MPADIRNFFGGKPASSASQEKKPDKPPAKKSRARKVVEDSDDDDQSEKPTKAASKPQSKTKAAKAPSPELVETTTSDYFATKSKPKRSEPTRTKPTTKSDLPATPTKSNAKPSKTATPLKKETPIRSSSRNTQPAIYADLDDFPDDDMEDADDLFAAEYKKPGIKQLDGQDDDVDFKDEDGSVVPDDDEMIIEEKPAVKTKPKAGAKRKAAAVQDDEDDDDDLDDQPKKKPRKAAAKTPAAKKAKTEPVEDSAEIKAILDDIPLVRPPTPPPPDGETKKFKFGGHNNTTATPAEAGNVDIPEGAENCLGGLTFVFTGVLRFLGRDEGQNLVKRYGGKVTTAPSKKTSYVVLGDDAGPKKLQTIRDHGLKTINEEGLFKLIQTLPPNGGDGKAAVEFAKKKAKEEEKIREAAEEIEKVEQEKLKADRARLEKEKATRASVGVASSAPGYGRPASSSVSANGPDNRLWTVKYAPTSMSQICGNKAAVEKLQNWLKNFPKAQRTNFKMPGKDGSGTYRAVIIHGPPGIGKTTAAHLVAKMEGYDIVESNASDTRSKKLVESGLRGVLGTTSLLGYFTGDGKEVETEKRKMVLIMDEVDGMSAGDRGGVGALAAVCKKTQIPMILICNERRQPKMKPFDFVAYDLPFRRPTTDAIRSRISTIAFREGMKMSTNIINALIEGSGADIRQIINMISTVKLDDKADMNFDEGKSMSKAWEKHTILKPWDITSKILGGGMFASSSKATLNDKIELYFNDHEFSYLMLQENYLGTNPMLSNTPGLSPKEKNFKQLDLACNAAESISDGDLIDRMIHGSQQQWSLMPAHAVFSFVRPASFVAGSLAGNQTRFTSWLGKNSSQGKHSRMIKEIQGHMRLRTSSDRHEIRQQYVPILWQNLVKKLEKEGKDAVPEVIELMDSYFLTKDDFDAITEMGVGYMDQERVKIESQAKATFTRL